MRRTATVAAFLSQVHERLTAKADRDYMLSVGEAMEVLRALLPWGTEAPVLMEYATLRERLREASTDLTGDGLGPIPSIDPDEAADIVEELAKATPPRVADWFDRMEQGEKIRLSLRGGRDGEVAVGTLTGFRDLPTVVVKLAPHTYTSWPLANVVEEGELQ